MLNADVAPAELAGTRVVCIPASRIAAAQGSSFGNVVMVGAVAAALGEPALEDVQDAAVELLGKKLRVESVRAAVEKGYRCLS
jgi:Pyruvate/2-oxoacid:ferredoxin oxidoreductase gamma subunit